MLSKTLAAVGLAASLTLSPATSSTAASTTSDPPTDRIVLDIVSANGSGCPKGSAFAYISPDNRSFRVSYGSYFARIGVGTSAGDFRKNCQLLVTLHHPTGFAYTIAETRPLGFASLQKGAYALAKSSAYFRGHPEPPIVTHRIDGPWDDDWYFEDAFDVATQEWEPCDSSSQDLVINTELRVFAGTSDPKTTTSFITMDTIDTLGGTLYRLDWRRCPTG